MGFAKMFVLIPVLILVLTLESCKAQSFNCSSSSPRSCRALVAYITVNDTDISAIQSLFGVKNLSSLLGANNLPLFTPRNYPISAEQVVKVPINCVCHNNAGTSDGAPVYTVQPGDGLYHIAAEVFSRLVTYPQIVAANRIQNANLIMIGQNLTIPLPCSCDEVDGEKVVHYAHMVKSGSTLADIAQEFGTEEEILARINGIKEPKDLKAFQPIDVPLKACNSSISNDSSDYPLLAANGTYVFTANGCVRCICDAANNWTLHCEPFQNRSSKLSACPSMECEGSEGLSLGSSASSGCIRSTCSYAGFNNSTIFTTLVQDSSTCSPSAPSNDVSRIKLNGDFLFILILLCFHLFQ